MRTHCRNNPDYQKSIILKEMGDPPLVGCAVLTFTLPFMLGLLFAGLGIFEEDLWGFTTGLAFGFLLCLGIFIWIDLTRSIAKKRLTEKYSQEHSISEAYLSLFR